MSSSTHVKPTSVLEQRHWPKFSRLNLFLLDSDRLFFFPESSKCEYIKTRDVRMKDTIPEDYEP